jgi:protein pelota
MCIRDRIKNLDGISHDQVYVLHSSDVGFSGLKEALSKGKGLDNLIEKIRYARESDLMDQLMSRIGKGKGAAYGLKEVRDAFGFGAVDMLMLTDEMFRLKEGKELLVMCTQTGASHMIISTSHDGGKMLDKIGGAAALLRFEI